MLRGSGPTVVEKTIGDRRVLITRSIQKRRHDYDEAWYFALALRHSKIMDVGANRGETALLALMAGDTGSKRMLLVDANAEALGVACHNVCLNDLGKAVVFRRGLVSDEAGKELEFFTVGPGEAGSIYASHAKSASQKNQRIKLTTTTIDALAEEQDFSPELIKIDVEGAELDALKGAERLAETNAIFFVEMHDLDHRPMLESARILIQWAEENGRTVHYLKDHTPLTEPETIANRGRCHVLILKKEQEYPEYLRQIGQRSPIRMTNDE